MGRSKKLPDALRPKGSRVEKARHEPKHTPNNRTLPEWYYRITRKYCDQYFGEPRESDFLEDLSELEFDSEEDCECDEYQCEDEECECLHHKDDTSNRSYNEGDADWYYKLKSQRERLKKSILMGKKEDEKKIKELRQDERSKKKEVKDAFRSMKNTGETSPLDFSETKIYDLFCPSHVKYFYHCGYSTKRLDLSWIEPRTMSDQFGKLWPKSRVLSPQIYLDSETCLQFEPLGLPQRTGPSPVKFKSSKGFDISIVFISDRYVKIKLSREAVFSGQSERPGLKPETSPKVFKFYGIWHTREEKRKTREAWWERNRLSSPSDDDWFFRKR